MDYIKARAVGLICGSQAKRQLMHIWVTVVEIGGESIRNSKGDSRCRSLMVFVRG